MQNIGTLMLKSLKSEGSAFQKLLKWNWSKTCS